MIFSGLILVSFPGVVEGSRVSFNIGDVVAFEALPPNERYDFPRVRVFLRGFPDAKLNLRVSFDAFIDAIQKTSELAFGKTDIVDERIKNDPQAN